MKKGFLLFFTLLLIFSGVYGAYYFQKLKKAETSINNSIIYIHEGKYDEALDKLKDIIAQYEFGIVRAPALYLLADTYEKTGQYDSAIATHRALITNEKFARSGNWYIQSLISISKLYRKGIIKISNQQIEIIENYLELIRERIKKKLESENTDPESLAEDIMIVVRSFLSFNYNIAIKEISQEELFIELETELGFLYLMTGKYDDAKEIFLKMNTPVSKFGLARSYLESGEEKKGIFLLEKLIKYDTTGKVQAYYLKETFKYAEHLYKMKRYDEAMVVFNSIKSEFENTRYSELSLNYLAKYYYNKNNAIAVKYIDKIISNSVHIKDEEALLLKGYIYYDKRNFLKALKVFNDFIKRFPKSDKISTAREWKAMCERSIKYLD